MASTAPATSPEMDPPTKANPRDYKVNLSLGRSYWANLKWSLKETFFPDDPFHGFHSMSVGERIWRVLRFYIPIFDWITRYKPRTFVSDLLAGVTVASFAIPQGISYASLANLPPIYGLYVSSIPPLLYALLGNSMYIAAGPMATSVLLLANTVASGVSPTDDPQLYISLILSATFIAGVLQFGMGILRLGILLDLLSSSAIAGFMAGTAITIIGQQLKGMFGMAKFTTNTDIVSVLSYVNDHREQWHWQAGILGLCFLVFLTAIQILTHYKPKLFWLYAIAPLGVVIFGDVFCYLIDGKAHGIPIVGDLKKGMNPSSVSMLNFSSAYIGTVLKAGLLAGTLALAEGVSLGRNFAMERHEFIDADKEAVAIGAMNLVGSLTSCYLSTGPFSKSAININSGGKTPMVNLIQGICVIIILLVLAPLFKYTPSVALAAVIISAMFGLIKPKEFIRLWKVDKFDFVIAMAAFFGVLFSTLITGLGIAIGLSVLRAMLYLARPMTSRLGVLPQTEIFCDIKEYPDAVGVKNILTLQVGSPLYFSCAIYFRERVARWVQTELEKDEETHEKLLYAVLDLGGVTEMDSSGIDALLEVHKFLEKKNVKAVYVNPRLDVVDKLVHAGFVALVGESSMFLSVEDAIEHCQQHLAERLAAAP